MICPDVLNSWTSSPGGSLLTVTPHPRILDTWDLQPHLDRSAELRTDMDALDRLWPSAKVLVVDREGRFEAASDPAAGGAFEPDRHIFLGRADGTGWFAMRGEVGEAASTLRDQAIDSPERETATLAVALLAWHDRARFCERCGHSTHLVSAGFARRCDGCGAENFPRTDPAVIVAVVDADDRLLLAHQVTWPEGRASLVAGFVEAGESAEHAVIREVLEEVGVRIDAMTFLASQPWPFPRSLMLGYTALGTGDVVPDGEEIEWGRWYSRDDLRQALASGELLPPGAGSIAGRIISLWERGSLPRPGDLA